MSIRMEAIGYIKSGIKEKKDLPRQSVLNQEKTAVIEILPKFVDGIEGIKENTYGIVLFHFHQSDQQPLRVAPHGSEKITGVFSTRSPNRPNGIGLSIVEFTKLSENKLEFKGVDMLDGTPVLDIKPYNAELNPK